MNWNDCELIYLAEDSQFQNVPKELLNPLKRYTNKIGHAPKHDVWCDTKTNTLFGLDLNWRNSSSKESSIIEDRKKFIKCFKGAHYVTANFSLLKGNRVENPEMIHMQHPEFDKFKGSKILLVGGGPSTNSINWDPNEYDHVWSCNHFFLNEKLKNTELAVVRVGDEVNVSSNNKVFHSYMENSNSLICLEDLNNSDRFAKIALLDKKYPDRCFYVHTRYRGKIGTLPRLLCAAVILGAKEISFVGLDGIKEKSKVGDLANHSFETNKINTGTCNYNLYRRHYVMLWDYVLNVLNPQRKVQAVFQNLGEGTEYNMTTDISKQMFPLQQLK